MIIVDRQWDDPAEPVAGQDSYVLFWLEERPVGHIVVSKGEAMVRPPLPAGAAAAIAREKANQAPATVDVSLVICTRDRPIPLAACLSGLSRQSVRPREVIVVDNASLTGETQEVALAAGATYMREDRPGLDFARNAGAMAARGAIVAYTDDDVVLHPRWLERMAAAFDEARIGAVTGLVLPAELDTEAQRLFEFHWGFGRGYESVEFGADFLAREYNGACPTWEIGAGASMAFRREVLERIGYFDERLDVGQSGCSGDSEAWHRVLAAGYTCRYEPGIAAFHYHRREMTELARQIRAYMRGHSSSVLVQFGTSRARGHLVHIFRDLPRNYFWRLRQRLKEGSRDENRLLRHEIAGFLSGILFIALRIGSPVRRRLRG